MQALRNNLSPDQRVGLNLSTAPSALPVSLEEAKGHMGVDFDDNDNEIVGAIYAATADAEHYINGPICTQSWIQKFDRFPACYFIELAKYPVQAITAIRYVDIDDTLQTLSTDVYDLDPDRNPSLIYLKPDQVWPGDCRSLTNDVEIEFVAGWTNVPPEIKQAVLVQVADLYENRENSIIGTIWTPTKTYERLLSPHRNIKV